MYININENISKSKKIYKLHKLHDWHELKFTNCNLWLELISKHSMTDFYFGECGIMHGNYGNRHSGT